MPGKPRFYNNRRPLNPRHTIVAPVAGVVTLAPVGVLQVSITDTNELTWDFDTDVLELGDFQNLGIVEATGVTDWTDVSANYQGPDSAVLAGPRTIVAQYVSTPVATDFVAMPTPGAGTGVKWIGRLIRELDTFYQLQTP